jgi:hypothetical protein
LLWCCCWRDRLHGCGFCSTSCTRILRAPFQRKRAASHVGAAIPTPLCCRRAAFAGRCVQTAAGLSSLLLCRLRVCRVPLIQQVLYPSAASPVQSPHLSWQVPLLGWCAVSVCFVKGTRAGRAHTPAPPAFPAAGWLLYLLGLTVCMSSQLIVWVWCLGTIQEQWDIRWTVLLQGQHYRLRARKSDGQPDCVSLFGCDGLRGANRSVIRCIYLGRTTKTPI